MDSLQQNDLLCHGFKMVHIGVNADCADKAMAAANLLSSLFGFAQRDLGAASVFVSPEIEIMKQGGRGAMGHIAIGCCNTEKAMAYLEGQGVKFLPETAKRKADGAIRLIYADLDICGFAVHLTEY